MIRTSLVIELRLFLSMCGKTFPESDVPIPLYGWLELVLQLTDIIAFLALIYHSDRELTIPWTIFCTILWLRNFLQSATAAISSPLRPVKDEVGSSLTSMSVLVTGACTIWFIFLRLRNRVTNLLEKLCCQWTGHPTDTIGINWQ